MRACKDAYAVCIQNCSQILVDCLANADSDEKKAQCKEHFHRAMKLCKEAREICFAACED
jgi:hypothetical protein